MEETEQASETKQIEETEQASETEQMEETKQASETKQMEEPEKNVTCIQRVSGYPIMVSAITQVTGLYERTKESNQLVKMTLQTAESGLKTVGAAAIPVVDKFEKQIGSLNNLTCSQLDRLETSYPIITQPTDEVLGETKKVYDENLKPTIDKVTGMPSAVKDYTVNTVTGIKTKTCDTVTAIKDYSIDKVSGAIQSPYGQTVVSKLDSTLDVVNSYVDYYLPPQAEGEETGKDDGSEKVNTVLKASLVTDKVRRRMYTKAMRDLHNIQTRSQETLKQLNFTVDLIQYARYNLDNVQSGMASVQQKVMDTWSEINKEESGEECNEQGELTVERRAIMVARHLTQELKHGLTLGKETASNLPENVYEKLEQTKKYSEDLYESFLNATQKNDLSNQILEQSKEKMLAMQESLNVVTDYIIATWPVTLLTPDIDLNELDFGDDFPEGNGNITYVPVVEEEMGQMNTGHL